MGSKAQAPIVTMRKRRNSKKMKKVVEKDKLKRYLFKKYEQKRLALKVLQRLPAMLEVTKSLSTQEQHQVAANSSNVGQQVLGALSITRYAGNALARLPRNSAKSRIRNRCVLTGRGNSIYRAFRISRIELRQCANNGSLPYVKKASW